MYSDMRFADCPIKNKNTNFTQRLWPTHDPLRKILVMLIGPQ